MNTTKAITATIITITTDDDGGRNSVSRAALCQEIGQSGGDLCNDPDEDDQRNTIADAAFGVICFAQPHQEHGAAHKP